MDLVGSILGGESEAECGLLSPSPADMEAFDATVGFHTDTGPLQSTTQESAPIDGIGGEELWEFPEADILSSVPSQQIDLDSLGASMPNNIETSTDQDGSTSQVDDAMALAEALISADYTQFDSFCLTPNVVQQQRQQEQQQEQSDSNRGVQQQMQQPPNRQAVVQQVESGEQSQVQPAIQCGQSIGQPTMQPVKREVQLHGEEQGRLGARAGPPLSRPGDLTMQENRHPAKGNTKAPPRKGKTQQPQAKAPEGHEFEPTSPEAPGFLKAEEQAVDDESSGSSMAGKPRDRSTQRKLRNKESARRYREKQVAKRRQLENFTRSLAEQNRELETLHEKLVSLTCGHAPITRTTSQITAGPLQDLNQDLRR